MPREHKIDHDPTTFEIHTYEDWAALYIKGVLYTEGEPYNIEEAIYDLLGIKVVQDDAFMCGRRGHGTASTLDKVNEYKAKRDADLQRAKEYREQAKALEQEAMVLENKAKGIGVDA